MPATFPTTKNELVNGDIVLPNHINALEDKVGIDSSADTSSHDYKIATLETDLNTAESNITTLQTDLNTAEAAVDALEIDVAALKLADLPYFTVGTSGAKYIVDGTNDEVQIQAAIAAALAAGGGIVHLFAQNFNLGSPGIAMLEGVILEGEGIDITTLTMNEAANYNPITGGEASDGDTAVSSDNCVLRDFTLDGNKTDVTGSGSILFYRNTGPTVGIICERLHIYDMEGVGILLRNCEKAIVRDCRFSGNKAGACVFYDNCMDCIMDNLIAEDESGAQSFAIMGAEVDGQLISQRCKIVNCSVDGGADGIWVGWGGGNANIVSNCTVRNCTGHGIRIYADKIGATDYHSVDSIISNNVVEDITNDGIRVETADATSNADGNIVIGNRVTGCNTGLRFTANADNNLYVGNLLVGNSSAAVTDSGAGNTASGNKTS